jgi:hypothetical protein
MSRFLLLALCTGIGKKVALACQLLRKTHAGENVYIRVIVDLPAHGEADSSTCSRVCLSRHAWAFRAVAASRKSKTHAGNAPVARPAIYCR